MNLADIKLIIWDLDETFWHGTLSEGDIECPKENIDLVVALSKRGIINSIASKNDYEQTKAELNKLGLWDYFVFPSIAWIAKGGAIAQIISDANLKPKNALFIDDNETNLAEARFLTPDLMTAGPEVIPDLIKNAPTLGKDDKELTRLEQYHQLEQKRSDEKRYSDPLEFLRQSNVRVSIESDCLSVFDRLLEMISRTNQLNYTKNRINEKTLRETLLDERYECAYVRCADAYGDYGIVGFYALEKSNHTLAHFLFSCRTMGLFLESYVYKLLRCPRITIVPPVSMELNPNLDFSYIHASHWKEQNAKHKKAECNVLLRGPCDLDAVLYYLKSTNVCSELSKTGTHGEIIYFLSHSQTLRDAYEPPRFDSPFYEPNAYISEIYNKPFDLIILSMLSESPFGVYEDDLGNRVVYGGATFDACTHPEDYLEGRATNGYDDLSEEDYRDFAKRFRFLGRLRVEQTIENLRFVLGHIPNRNARVCFLLGPTESLGKTEDNPSLLDVAGYYAELNAAVIKLCSENKNYSYIDPTAFEAKTLGHEMYYSFKSVTHYSRKTYQMIAVALHKKYPKLIRLNPLHNERFRKLRAWMHRRIGGIRHVFGR